MIDLDSLADVLYYESFEKTAYIVECLVPFKEAINGFTNISTLVVDTINLKVSIGVKEARFSRMIQFMWWSSWIMLTITYWVTNNP